MVEPRDSGFRLVECKPVHDESPCSHIEFAHHRRVRSAPRQRYQRPRMVGLDHVGAGPNPVLCVGARQLVDIDDYIPVGGLVAIARQGRAPPEPARVGRVSPEVIEVFAAAAHIGDSGVGVEYRQGVGAHLLEPLVAELVGGGLIALTHPGKGSVTVDLFQPQVRVVGHARHSRRSGSVNCVTCSHGRRRRWLQPRPSRRHRAR